MTTEEFSIILDKKLKPLQESIKSLEKRVTKVENTLRDEIKATEQRLGKQITALDKRVTSVEMNLQDQIKTVEAKLLRKGDTVETRVRAEIKTTQILLEDKMEEETRKEENLLKTAFDNLMKLAIGKQTRQFDELKSAVEQAFERTTKRFEVLEERVDEIDQRTQPL